MREQRPAIGVARSDEGEIRTEFVPLIRGQFDRPVDQRIGRHRHIRDIALTGLAKRVQARSGEDQERQIEAALVLALGRPPLEKERLAARKFFRSHEADAGDPSSALVHYCQALLNVNEFVYLE